MKDKLKALWLKLTAKHYLISDKPFTINVDPGECGVHVPTNSNFSLMGVTFKCSNKTK